MFGKFKKQLYVFKSTKSLTYCSLLVALTVIFSIFSFYITPALKFSISYIFIAVIAKKYGGICAGCSAAIADIIQYLVKPIGPYQPLLTLTCILTGIIYAIFLYENKSGIVRIAISRIITSLLVSTLIDTYFISILYGNVFTEFLLVRFIKNITLLPIEIVILIISIKTIDKIESRIK